MNHIKLTYDKLDPTEISELAVHESCGAVSLFIGTTRDNFDGKQVTKLEYEAYDDMAIKIMNKICDEMRLFWPDIKNICIYHRLGLVPVKEASVVIACSSPHRNTSLEALPFALRNLKQSVPIFKREYYKDKNGSSEWKENPECTWSKKYQQQLINNNLN
ncbi:hypothetical protein PVAND_002286 [Polypedilum vanderplanki]|uniref:Molybdopterin synthase catalytic subunit n=1 Tax=Polypedilum vanderplanki TaxID=319348 RepID=A0A9J6BQI7_POLVA|nr:hypothetical protein PVAND_002286 [Polypedilum vanderplanki]